MANIYCQLWFISVIEFKWMFVAAHELHIFYDGVHCVNLQIQISMINVCRLQLFQALHQRHRLMERTKD